MKVKVKVKGVIKKGFEQSIDLDLSNVSIQRETSVFACSDRIGGVCRNFL